MSIDPTLLDALAMHHLLAIFVGSVIFGEAVIAAAAYLAGTLQWSLINVFSVAFLGTVTADLGWYLAGRYLVRHAVWWERFQDKYGHIVERLDSLVKHRLLLSMLAIKFLYGTRVLTVMYLSGRRVPARTFIAYDAIATIPWVITMVILGWLAGKGLALLSVVTTVEQVAAGLVAIIVVVNIASLWITKRVGSE